MRISHMQTVQGYLNTLCAGTPKVDWTHAEVDTRYSSFGVRYIYTGLMGPYRIKAYLMINDDQIHWNIQTKHIPTRTYDTVEEAWAELETKLVAFHSSMIALLEE